MDNALLDQVDRAKRYSQTGNMGLSRDQDSLFCC